MTLKEKIFQTTFPSTFHRSRLSNTPIIKYERQINSPVYRSFSKKQRCVVASKYSRSNIIASSTQYNNSFNLLRTWLTSMFELVIKHVTNKLRAIQLSSSDNKQAVAQVLSLLPSSLPSLFQRYFRVET